MMDAKTCLRKRRTRAPDIHMLVNARKRQRESVDKASQRQAIMAPSALVKEEGASTAKRKAESPSESVSDSKRFKASTSPTPTLEHDTGDAVQSSAPRVVPFPEKPAVRMM